MKTKFNRRSVLKNIAAGAGITAMPLSLTNIFAASDQALGPKLKGQINHSVCKWCYGKIPLDTFAQEAKKLDYNQLNCLDQKTGQL